MRMFWLVQRMVRKERPSDEPSPMAPMRSAATCFDRMFGCEYMGSSEFEWGAIPKAYQKMNSLELAVWPVEITRGDVTRTVYFIAADDPAAYENCEDSSYNDITSFDQAIEEFRRWFSQDHLSGQEQPYFEFYFADDFPWYMQAGKGSISAWWSLDDNIAWTLDETIATELLSAFKPDPSLIEPEEVQVDQEEMKR